jgi:hypothetical protein
MDAEPVQKAGIRDSFQRLSALAVSGDRHERPKLLLFDPHMLAPSLVDGIHGS